MKMSNSKTLRKLLVLTAALVLLAAVTTGCVDEKPTDETVNKLPSATETQEPSAAPTTSPTEEPTDPPEDAVMGTVTTDNLNIRSNPSTDDSTVITQLAVSTRVQIFERKTVNGVPWGRIEQGWINLNYVAIDGEDNTQPTEPDVTEPPVDDKDDKDDKPSTGTAGSITGTVTAESLNIREGAGSKYDMVGKYNKGDKVTILETKNGWGRTDKGWISMNYVKTDGSGSNSGSSSTGTGTITAEALHIRKGAGSEYDSIGKYYKGDKVTILETMDGWGKTDKGWISLKYVSGYSNSGSSTNKEPVKSFTGEGVITAEALYIREGAGSKYKDVGKYYKGEKVTILETKNGWGKTDKGWISLAYVKESSGSSGTSTGKTGTGTITASSLYIREGAGTDYDAVGSYKKGEKVTILETKNGWGKTDKGWISLKYVDMDD